MKSLLAQCAIAAFAAAAASASVSMAQDSRPAGIGVQIEALGLDRAEIRAKLDSLSRDERIAYLQSLGIQLPEITALTPGTAFKVNPDAATGTVTPLPAPADGKFTIMPWTGSIDGNVTGQPLPVRPGSVSSNGAVVIDPAVVNGAAFTPAQLPAKP